MRACCDPCGDLNAETLRSGPRIDAAQTVARVTIDDEGNLGQIKYWRTNDFTIVAE